MDYQGYEELVILDDCKNYNQSICQRIKRQMPEVKPSVLDFGAGLGTLAKILKKDGYQVRCVEIDERLQVELRAKGFEVFKTLEEVPEASFDLIYSSNVLEHIEDDEETLRQLLKKLKPGGKLCLYLPAFQSLYSDFDKKIGHFRRYRYADLRAKLLRAGYKLGDWAYADSLGFFALLVLKRFPSKNNITRSKIEFYDKILFPISSLMDTCCGLFFGKNIFMVAEKT